MQLPSSKHLSGFTLMEMLIVVAIIIILFAIGLGSFGGMQDSIAVTENFTTLLQDIRWAQRSSISLKRELTEWWPYGIGIDLSRLDVDGTYTFFKWCSPFSQFDPNGDARMNSELPNFDTRLGLGDPNGAGVSNAYITINSFKSLGASNQCGASNANTIIELKGRGPNVFSKRVKVINTTGVKYVLFESVTGRAFMYNANGQLLNYSGSVGSIAFNATNPVDIQLEPTSLNLNLAKHFTVSPVSGVIKEMAPK